MIATHLFPYINLIFLFTKVYDTTYFPLSFSPAHALFSFYLAVLLEIIVDFFHALISKISEMY